MHLSTEEHVFGIYGLHGSITLECEFFQKTVTPFQSLWFTLPGGHAILRSNSHLVRIAMETDEQIEVVLVVLQCHY